MKFNINFSFVMFICQIFPYVALALTVIWGCFNGTFTDIPQGAAFLVANSHTQSRVLDEFYQKEKAWPSSLNSVAVFPEKLLAVEMPTDLNKLKFKKGSWGLVASGLPTLVLELGPDKSLCLETRDYYQTDKKNQKSPRGWNLRCDEISDNYKLVLYKDGL